MIPPNYLLERRALTPEYFGLTVTMASQTLVAVPD